MGRQITSTADAFGMGLTTVNTKRGTQRAVGELNHRDTEAQRRECLRHLYFTAKEERRKGAQRIPSVFERVRTIIFVVK